jgi:hypothetical protein
LDGANTTSSSGRINYASVLWDSLPPGQDPEALIDRLCEYCGVARVNLALSGLELRDADLGDGDCLVLPIYETMQQVDGNRVQSLVSLRFLALDESRKVFLPSGLDPERRRELLKWHIFPSPMEWSEQGGDGPLVICAGLLEVISVMLHCPELHVMCLTALDNPAAWTNAASNLTAGREVWLAFPFDIAHQTAAQNLAQRIKRSAAQVRILAWPGQLTRGLEPWPEAGPGVCDFFRLGGNEEQLRALGQASNPLADDTRAVVIDGPSRFFKLNQKGKPEFSANLLAEELVKELGLIQTHEGPAYTWTGKHFRLIKNVELMSEGYKRMGEQAKPAWLENAIKLARSHPQAVLPFDQTMNSHPELLNLPSGMLNLDTAELLEHDPSYRSTFTFPFDADPHNPKDCPLLKDYLLEAVGDWGQCYDVQQFGSYCLWPSNEELLSNVVFHEARRLSFAL